MTSIKAVRHFINNFYYDNNVMIFYSVSVLFLYNRLSYYSWHVEILPTNNRLGEKHLTRMRKFTFLIHPFCLIQSIVNLDKHLYLMLNAKCIRRQGNANLMSAIINKINKTVETKRKNYKKLLPVKPLPNIPCN